MDEKLKPWASKIKKLFKRIFSYDPPIITAEEAYNITVYGKQISEKDIVSGYQKRINVLINNKVSSRSFADNSYYCVVDFEPFIEPYINDILKPFYEGGFEIINLSEKIKEVKENFVYLISWKK